MTSPALKSAAISRFRSVSRSHAGTKRSINEDRVLDRGADGLWAVADGMGGQRAGAAAATRLIEALADVEHGPSGYACLADIIRGVETVNAGLFDSDDHGLALSGTTLVALLVHEGFYACLWAGDSRAYLLRDGRLERLSRDHSLVQEMIDGGAISQAEGKSHPGAHVVTRGIGVAATVELERRFGPLASGDLFLLCSDGLTGCVEDDEIAGILSNHPLDGAADRLLETALSRQARDNVSFVIIEADEP